MQEQTEKGYLTLLRGIQTIHTISQYIAAEGDPTDATNKSIIKLWKLNEMAYKKAKKRSI